MLKKSMLGLLAVLMLLLLVLAGRAAQLKPEHLSDGPAPPLPVDEQAVQRLAEAIRIPTVSTEAAAPDNAHLEAFADHLARSFPRVHALMKREVIAGHSLLFTWPGTDTAAPALLLAAHQDVVPVEAESATKWLHPPFAGSVAAGFIWGRGALDDKGSLLAIMEACERQLGRGYRPARTIYLAFGHDEERGGNDGARAIARLLKQRGARIGLVLDEGGAVTDGLVPGVPRPVAVVSVAEKGFLSVELSATARGGHSSMPGTDNPVARIARAVDRLTNAPFPARMDGVTENMLAGIAPYTNPPRRLILANSWLFGPLVKRQLLSTPQGAATLRTTIAPTIVSGGTKENVLPQGARAVINHRIIPGETVESVLAHDRLAIDDPGIALKPLRNAFNPSPAVSADSPQFAFIRRAIRANFPNAAVVPSLAVGATDGRHYSLVAPVVLRFFPEVMTRWDVDRAHGTDERISIANHMRAIAFYERLIDTVGAMDVKQ